MASHLAIGSRVEITAKGIQGNVAFIGTTSFAAGKWIGVILDEPKGKNNGSIQGKSYFQCEDNHGTFVRVSQLTLIDDGGNKIDLSAGSTEELTPRTTPGKGRASGIPMASRSREDISTPTSTPSANSDLSVKRSSFVESGTPSKSRLTDESRLSKSTMSLRSKIRMPIAGSSTGLDKLAGTVAAEQTGFVETLRPQFTPGVVRASPSATTPRTPPQTVSVHPAELENLKGEIQNYKEKLETLKVRYKEKMHENDSLKLKLDQAAEFKIKIMESQASIKKELEQVKQEKEKVMRDLEELSDVTESLEMATIDKEMAEEKVETLQIDLEDAKQKIEELTLDYELLKAEFDKLGCAETSTSDDANIIASSYQVKQLEQQNIRLRDTLVRLRDLSAHEKYELQKLLKELETKKNENSELYKTNEIQKARIGELESTIADLHEQVDAALGAEEMVEQLGMQKLGMEDRIKQLQDDVQELEELRDVNNQLMENYRELEIQLREEIDITNAEKRESAKEKEIALEALADRESTIVKFRELVRNLQEQYKDLQTQLQSELSSRDNLKTSIPEMLDYKKMFAETKAQAREIDLEMRKMEVMQLQQHVQYLLAFMPESYVARGGDNDAVLTVILLTRLLRKCEILQCQIRDKFPSVELSNKGELVKGYTAEQYASRCRFSFHLHLLQACLRQFIYGLNTCSPEALLKIGDSLREMSQQEKILDSYIELLKTDQLDENVKLENLEKCVEYFNAMQRLLIMWCGDTCLHQTKLLQDHSIAFSTACDGIRTDVAIVQALIQNDDIGDISAVCEHLATVAEVMQEHLKQIRRRISATPDCTVLPIPELATNLRQMAHYANKLAKALREMAKTAFSQIALTTDEIYLPAAKLLEICNAACDNLFDEVSTAGAVACLKSSMNYFANEVANIAQAVQEAESYLATLIVDNQQKPIPPILARASLVKRELEQTKELQARLEGKDKEVKELRNLIKAKQEEISELNVRKDMAEKKSATSDTKLANLIREKETAVQELQRKLDDAHQLIKRKETEYEKTMDHLQADIDSLECEKGELKDKLKTYSKKGIIEGISKNSSISISNNTSVVGFASPACQTAQYRESPFVFNEIRALRSALEREKMLRNKIEGKYCAMLLQKLEPLPVFKQDSELDPELLRLEKDAEDLDKDILWNAATFKVPDLSKRTPGLPQHLDPNFPMKQILDEIEAQKSFKRRFDDINLRLAKYSMKRKNGGVIRSDLTEWPLPNNGVLLKAN